MADYKWRFTPKEILALADKGFNEKFSALHSEMGTDDRYFEGDIKADLSLPKQYIVDATVLPIARQIIYTYADHVNTSNARVYVNKKGDKESDEAEADMEQKMGQALLYRNNVAAPVAPLRMSAIHQAVYGMSVVQTAFSADNWPDKPLRKSGESDKEYAIRLEEFREARGCQLPIIIRPVNPRNIIWDWSYGTPQWVIEKHERVCLDVGKQWKKWSNPKGKKDDDEVTIYSAWNNWYRCELADGEPLFRLGDGVVSHKYGFYPYTFIESGMGNMSYDADFVKRYVGLLRYIRDVVCSASRNYSLADISYKRGALPFFTIEGDRADEVGEIDTSYGQKVPMPPGTKLVLQSPPIAPEAVNRHWERTLNIINEFAAPRSVQGLSDTGVRSAAQEYARQAQGGVRFDYPIDSYRAGVADILGKAILIQKRVIGEEIKVVWANSPTDEWDIIIDPKKIREPVTYRVEFRADDATLYRKHDDLIRLVKGLNLPTDWALGQLDGVNKREVQVMGMRQAMLQFYTTQLTRLAEIKRRKELGLPLEMPLPAPTVGANGEPEAESAPGRRIIAPSSPKAQPGSPAAMQNGLESERSPMAMSATQGMGGGGNR